MLESTGLGKLTPTGRAPRSAGRGKHAPLVVTVGETTQLTGWSESHVRRLIKDGRLGACSRSAGRWFT